ncbi:hypothetical protein H9P43_002385 [Blastocladiella emersonii ATCC 22665]|nr:hypothetical protein H9P43_002385 [Blastocladiella emersonii ATCC 22665]
MAAPAAPGGAPPAVPPPAPGAGGAGAGGAGAGPGAGAGAGGAPGAGAAGAGAGAAAGAGAGGAAAAPAVPVVLAPPPPPGAVLPACQAWRPPPPGETAPAFWVIGCVQSATGFQCGPNQPFAELPTCSLRNWNANCPHQPWLLPQVPPVTQRVPIYGCISNEAIPTGYLCPSLDVVVPSGTTDPSLNVNGNVDQPCFVAPPNTTTTDMAAATPSDGMPTDLGMPTDSSTETAAAAEPTDASASFGTSTNAAMANSVVLPIHTLALWIVLLNLIFAGGMHRGA